MALSTRNHYRNTCTQGAWSVSYETTNGNPEATLHVFILREGFPPGGRAGMTCRFQYGDANGRKFPDGASAMRFALSRGYLRPWFKGASQGY